MHMNKESNSVSRRVHLQSSSKKESVNHLLAFKKERGIMIIASVLINLLALAFPLLMLQLYDRILSHRSVDTLVVFCVAVGTAIALEAVIRVFRSYTTAWISARFEHQGYLSLTSRFLAEPINDFERKGTGAILEDYKSISTLRYHYSGQTFQQLMDLPFTFLYVSIIFFISPLIGISLVICYLVFVFITWKNALSYPAFIKEQREMDLRRGNLLTEILKNVHTMKSMTMESLMLRRYERLQESCAKVMSQVTYSLEMSAGVGAVFSPLMTVMVVALCSWLVITGNLSNGEMAACIMLGLRALSPLQRLGGMWSKHQQDKILRDKLNVILAKPGLPAHEKTSEHYIVSEFDGKFNSANISLTDVAFNFPGIERDIFHNLSLDVEAGECIAIGGQSGSGRSTLLQLIAGIIDPTAGEIKINGQNLKEINIEDLAKQVAYLPKEPLCLKVLC